MRPRYQLYIAILLMCLFSCYAYAEYVFNAAGFVGDGKTAQDTNGLSISSIIGQPFIGYSVGESFILQSGFGFIINEMPPMTEKLEPPLNFRVSDVPNDNGHSLKLNWEKSPSESQGLVSWYRIFRSLNSTLTEPIPLTRIASVDSLVYYEQFYTLLVDSVAVGRLEYTDSVLKNGVKYYYWLQAVGSQGGSAKIAAGYTTQVKDNPEQFQVGQPFPNPFNPSSTIAITLLSDSNLLLAIYNISGQRVTTITDKLAKAGRYNFVWDGRGMPSGVYFWKIQIENNQEIKKAMLLK